MNDVASILRLFVFFFFFVIPNQTMFYSIEAKLLQCSFFEQIVGIKLELYINIFIMLKFTIS
jgi:hypothetical protein